MKPLVRLTFRFSGEKQCLVDCVAEVSGGREPAAQISDDNRFSADSPAIGGDASIGGQGNFNNPVSIAECRRFIEENKGRIRVCDDRANIIAD